MTTIVLYGRPGCCLCDDAREVLERVRSVREFEFVQRDIEADESLLRAYLERIPVVTIDGLELFELFVDEQQLISALEAAGSPGPDRRRAPGPR
jgi:glutaredoxin